MNEFEIYQAGVGFLTVFRVAVSNRGLDMVSVHIFVQIG